MFLVENPEHSDFTKLRNMLIRYVVSGGNEFELVSTLPQLV